MIIVKFKPIFIDILERADFGTYRRLKHESSGNQDTLKEIEDLGKALEKVNQKLREGFKKK